MGGEMCPHGDSVGMGPPPCSPLTERPCKLFPGYTFLWWQSLAPSTEAQPEGGQPLPTAALLFPGGLRARPSQARELPEGISPLALCYQPWASIQGSFPSCVASGSSASIAAVPGPVPGPQESPRDSGSGREPPPPPRGWLCLSEVGAVSRGRVSRGRG